MKPNRLYAALILTVVLFSFLISCDSDGDNTGKQLNPDDLVVNISSNQKNIDMSQFKKTLLGIPYAGNKNIRQTLDIIYPRTAKAPYKIIMVFHGGGWVAGDKQSGAIAPLFHAAGQGYAIVSVNYRLSDEITWPEPLYDAKSAIRFIRTNADKYRLDTKNIVVWGVSAGGHIAEMLAATNNLPRFENLAMGNEKESSAVQGVVAWYGVSDIGSLTETGKPYADKIMGFEVHKNKKKTSDASPIELVTDQFPPILLVHGTKDEVVPFRQSAEMAKKINKATGRLTARLIPFIGAVHGDAVIKTNDSVAECLSFIDGIVFNGKNPYRNKKFPVIKTR